MTEKPVKPLSERIREAADHSEAQSQFCIERAMHAETLTFLAELAEEQAEIKAMPQARKDT